MIWNIITGALWSVLFMAVGWNLCNAYYGRLVTKIKDSEFKTMNRKVRV